jgi:hypothetical protein
MTTLDNIIRGEVYYIDCKNVFPKNDLLLQQMDKTKIISIYSNEALHSTFEYIDTNYSIGGVDFKSNIKDSFILKNEDALQYLQKSNWCSIFEIIQKQTILPRDVINYFVINYVDKTNIDTTINYFITGIQIDTNKEPVDFKKMFSKPKKYNFQKDNLIFIKMISCMMKFDFEVMNNIQNKSDENMEVSSRISQCNTNYMHQKMIEQPEFLNFNLYYFQRADVNFFLQREKEAETTKFILDDKKIVNWGKKFQCVLDKKDGEETCTFIPRRTIHNYEGELNSYYGGCLCNSPGLGKTVEILTLCCMEPSLNLIIVPNHLFEHWIFEYNKHIKKGYMNLVLYTDDDSIDLTTYSDKPTIVLIVYKKLEKCSKLLTTRFTRLIIDEFHELFDKKDMIFPLVNEVNAKYKWAVTGTPFVNSLMINNILNFVVKNKITNPSISKYKAHINTFCDMFRKNTKESVALELALPRINEKIYVLKLSDFEKTMYDSLDSGVDAETLITRQMAFCINPNLYFQDAHGISEKYQSVNILEGTIINMHQADFEKLFKKMIMQKIEFLKLKKDVTMTNSDIIYIYDNIINKTIDYVKIKDILNRLYNDKVKYKGKIINMTTVDNKIIDEIWKKYLQDKLVNNPFSIDITHHNTEKIINDIKQIDQKIEIIKHKMIFFEQQMKLINSKSKKLKRKTAEEDVEYIPVSDIAADGDEITCSICMGEIEDDFTMVQCGHAFCTTCLKTILIHNPDRCPQCSFSLKNTILYTPRFNIVLNREMVEMITKYGTKIAHLINILKHELSTDKTIIYCDSPSLINNLVEFLVENEISAVTPTPDKSILDTVNEFKTIKQILVLSSEFNASGLNIQFAKSIILLQPIRGDYARIRQTEHQIIGRLHRIGQTKEINLIRLIIKDSIESDILRQNKIIDTEIISSNKKTDYPMTLKETKELDS